MNGSNGVRAKRRRLTGALAALLAALGIMVVSTATASADPVWDVQTRWGATNLAPGGIGQFYIQVKNFGTSPSSGLVTVTEELPPGVTRIEPLPFDKFVGRGDSRSGVWSCSGTSTVTCTRTAPIQYRGSTVEESVSADGSGYADKIMIKVAIDPGAAEATYTNTTTVSGSGAPSASDVDPITVSSTSAGFGITPGSFVADLFDGEYPFGDPERQAGAHPYEMRVGFDLNHKVLEDPDAEPSPAQFPGMISAQTWTDVDEHVRTVEAILPRGMIGNPEATPKCTAGEFANAGVSSLTTTGCPVDTQVGTLAAEIVDGHENGGFGSFTAGGFSTVAVYNLEPPKGVPADFGFQVGPIKGHIYPTLDPANNYAIKADTPLISDFLHVRQAKVTIWGVPGDPRHDHLRAHEVGSSEDFGASFNATIKPLLTNPMDCGFDNGGTIVRADSWQHPDQFTPKQEYPDALNVNGCDDPRFRFKPDISMQPTSRDAGGPTGLDVHLEVPQRNDAVKDAAELYAPSGDLQAIPTPPIKKAVVTFPEGMTISASAAQGLGTCTSAQIGMGTNQPVRCPQNSQYGTLTLHTPILPVNEQPEGDIYIAKQGDNPFQNFLTLYLVIEEPDRGILVKIPGRAELDPDTGQIKTTFDDLPQFPVDDMQMSFKGGLRAALVNPTTCGGKTIKAEFFSWQDPGTPHLAEDQYEITNKPDGSPCVNSLAERPFAPQLEAGTYNNTAGEFSPFAFRLTRTDDDQEFSQLGVTMPPGLSAKIAGISECPDAAIAQAESRVGAGEGALEQSSPSCPASSFLGTTEVGAGVGVPLTFVPGKVYLAGPYRGEALSMVVISPAVVGPYDLGVIAVRSAIHVDPVTAQVSVKTEPFPQIFQGIPVRIRDIRVRVDRPQTTLNPTNCSAMAIGAQVTGTGGNLKSTADDTTANLSQRFQAADCAALGFKPKLDLRLFGGTKRGAHPKLKATLRMPEGGANIASTSVALPRSAFLDQSHIRTVCTRVQFAADECPAGSIYGNVTATTPLLDETLSGPVYMRSSSNKLPDLVAVLKGKLEVHVVGRIDSVNGGIRTTFDTVPDQRVSSFTLNMQGGKKGLLVNSRNLCKGAAARATAKFTAQNGKPLTLRPKMSTSCKGKGSKRGR